jgi:hypothetical protein
LGEVAEVAPHELGSENPVWSGALLQSPGEVAVVGVGVPQRVGLGGAGWHLAVGEALDDVGVALGIEVLMRPARQTRTVQRLEVLLGMTGNARPVELVAQ